MNIFGFLIIGALAGLLASRIMQGSGYGMLGDVIIGMLGALIGGFLFSFLGIYSFSLIGSFVTALVGAILLIWVLRLIKK